MRTSKMCICNHLKTQMSKIQNSTVKVKVHQFTVASVALLSRLAGQANSHANPVAARDSGTKWRRGLEIKRKAEMQWEV